MAKENGEKTKETAKPTAAASAHAAPSPGVAKKGHTAIPGGCHAWGCKASATRFNFCAEHYDHFKFGLIKKTGEPAPDYEKKIEHYTAHLASRKNTKSA